MSLNRYEQTIFDYWQKEPDELRHWQNKVRVSAQSTIGLGETARDIERDLWEYFMERSQYVPIFRNMSQAGLQRVSLLNLAEYLLRLWGPVMKKRNQSSQTGSG